MVSREQALQLIQDSLSSLQRVGLIEKEVTVSEDTVLLGTGSALDSIAFVTFVTDLEERLDRESNQEIYIVLDEIHEFNAGNTSVPVGVLARYIEGLTGVHEGDHG